MKRKPKFGKLGSKLSKEKLSSSLSTVSSIRPGSIPLSIEFGVAGIKVIQLSGTNPSSIVAAAYLPTPDDLLDQPAKRLLFQMDALPKFLKGEKINASRATSLIPSGQMICKHLQIIPTEGVPIEQIASAQLSAQIGCAPGELLVRCRPVEAAQKNGKVEVICYAASREFVGRIMGALKAAKLEPVGIHTEFDAIQRAMQLRNTAGEEGGSNPTLVLDLGSGSTKVLIVQGDNVLFARNIELGARHLDEAICHQLRCTMMEAQEIRWNLESVVPQKVAAVAHEQQADETSSSVLDPIDGPNAEPVIEQVSTTSHGPQVDLSEQLEMLTDEVSMCLRYHSALIPGQRVDRVVFVGGLASQNQICHYIAKRLRLDGQVLDPLACLARSGKVPASGVDLRCAQPGWASVVGGALSPTDL